MSDKKNKGQILKPFGPSIAKLSIPKKIIDDLNIYIDQVVDDKKRSEELDHGKNLVGNVKQEFRIENDFAKKIGWIDFLASGCKGWVENTSGEKMNEFKLLNTWVVRQFSGEYNPMHYHKGHISGVGYLKVPNNLGKTFQKHKKDNTNGMLSLVHGSRMFLSKSIFNIEPKVGDFYFFPNYLMHCVYPFYSDNDGDERRSISFNAKVDDNIYHI